jgi:hypothetical protein
MTSIRIAGDAFDVGFARWEKVLGLVRDVSVPLASIRDVEVVPDGYHGTLGLRAPGLGVPGRRKLGTWRGRGSKQLVSVSGGQPAVRIRLRDEPYTELLIGADDAAALAAGLDRARR